VFDKKDFGQTWSQKLHIVFFVFPTLFPDFLKSGKILKNKKI